MNSRTPLWRSLGALMALWAFAVQMEPAALHVCAMHSPTTAESAAAPMGHDHGASQSADSPADPENECCTCPDNCAAALATQVPSAGELVIPALRAFATTQPEPRDDVRPTNVDRLLPFANGPPTA